jgi:hypothetical protein
MLLKNSIKTRDRSFTEFFRYVHIVRLDINIDNVKEITEQYLQTYPDGHYFEQCAFNDRAIIDGLQAQILNRKKPCIKVSHSRYFRDFLDNTHETMVNSLGEMSNTIVVGEAVEIHSLLRDELINDFSSFDPNLSFNNLLRTYGMNFEINPKLHTRLELIGTKICQSLEQNPNIKSYFCNSAFQLNSSILTLIAGNCLLGGMLYNLDFSCIDGISYKDCFTSMVNELKLIKNLYEYFGSGVNILNIELNSLPLINDLVNHVHPLLESVSTSIPPLLESVSTSIQSNLNCYQSNRLFIKKIPIIGDLIFKIVEYYINSNSYLSIGSFAERTVDLSIKYTIQFGNYFNCFSEFNYVNPTLSDGSLSSSGESAPDGNPDGNGNNFNKKVKVIGVFGLGFILVVGVAKLFGSN